MPNLAHVLVVDSDQELMAALCKSLKEQGYAVSGYTSGTDALQALCEQDFDLLLLDLLMPQMDGIEILRKALEVDPNITGIIMTGQGTVQKAVEAMKVGAFDFVQKPFEMELLLTVLSCAMEMRRLRDENLQLRESTALYDLNLAVSHSLDINVILEKIADAVIEQCGADGVSILLPANNNELYVALTRSKKSPERTEDTSTPAREGAVVKKRRFLQKNDPDGGSVALRTYGKNNKSSLSIPLLVGGKCVGGLEVTSKKTPSFPLGKIKALKILAGTAASALENAWLYEAVQKAEQNYRSIFENAVEGIFRVTIDGYYSLVNPSMARIMGYDKPESLEGKAADINYESLLNGLEEKTGIERQICRLDGTSLWVSENIWTVRDDEGRILYFEGAMEDISKRKEAERYEGELARLDRLNLIGELAASIGHEIRNPMTSVRGFLQMLRSKEDCRPYHSYYELMIEELDRANTIISEYLNVANNKPLELSPGYLNDIIESLYPMIQADAQYKDKQVRLDLDHPFMTFIDEKEIRQLILNIARNGLEAMPTGGTLIIGTRIEQGKAVLFVQDQGCGIEPQLLSRLGTPFLTTKEDGTGLGLTVCYGIAARHNAKIEVDTGPEGTTFWVRFQR